MNDNDIKKCKKNGYVWVSDDDTPYKISRYSGGTRWNSVLRQICNPCLHPTRAAAQAAIDERKRLARLAEYRKSMEPITPEQAKDLRGGDVIYRPSMGRVNEDFDTVLLGAGCTCYWTREAAEAALLKQKACADLIDADDDVYEFDGHRNEYFGKVHSVCPQMVGVPRETCGKDIRSTKNRLLGSKQTPVESHETPIGETQAKEVVTDETQIPKPTTVRGWLETIPDPAIREAAIRQCECWDKNCISVSDAILNIWDWGGTSEGVDFWEECRVAAKHNTAWPSYPPKAKQEADGWTQEEIEKAAFSPREWTDIPQDVKPRETESILAEAERLVHGDRRRDYGTPDENFSRIARRWAAILGHPVTTTQVVECMIALKFARQEEKPKRDNWVDIAGYAQCGSELTTTPNK